jgi:hypothetical protein
MRALCVKPIEKFVMLNPFSNKAKLVRAVRKLCIYNDKRAAWENHTQSQMHLERDKVVSEIKIIIGDVGPSSLPAEIIHSVDLREFSEELEGKYLDMLKEHFKYQCNILRIQTHAVGRGKAAPLMRRYEAIRNMKYE